MVKDLKKVLKLKNYIYGHLKFLIKLKALNKKEAYLAIVLSSSALVFEALGVSILLPLLSFIQVDETYQNLNLAQCYHYIYIIFFTF